MAIGFIENSLVNDGKMKCYGLVYIKQFFLKFATKQSPRKCGLFFVDWPKKNINKGKLHLPYIGFDCLLLWKSHFLKLVPLLHVKTILEQFAKTKK